MQAICDAKCHIRWIDINWPGSTSDYMAWVTSKLHEALENKLGDYMLEGHTLMGDAALRFKYVEHPTTMLLGAVLITVGNAKSKRAESGQEKAKAVVVWFGIGLALIALRFPWEAFLQGA